MLPYCSAKMQVVCSCFTLLAPFLGLSMDIQDYHLSSLKSKFPLSRTISHKPEVKKTFVSFYISSVCMETRLALKDRERILFGRGMNKKASKMH